MCAVPENHLRAGNRVVMNRRNALRLAAASVPVVAGLGLPSVAQAAPGRPSGADYIRYEDLYRPGDTLQAVINKVTGNRILTLPEGQFDTYDFRSGYYDGIRIGNAGADGCRGLAGSGRNTYVRVFPNTATRDMGNRIAGNQICIASKPGAVLSNFALRGGDQNGLYYNGILVLNCPDAQLSWLFLRGASHGYAQVPPGETMGISILRSDRVTLSDCEVDGRDDAYNLVGASPIGWNFCRDAKMYRCYCHDGKAGMLTFYETTNIYTEDYSTYRTASGAYPLGGHGINHEQSNGVIRHIRPNINVRGVYSRAADASSNGGMHMSMYNVYADMPDVRVEEPTWDPGPGSTGMFAVGIYDNYTHNGQTQKVRTGPTIIKNGIQLQPSHHPTPGFGDKDPARYYSWIH